MTLENAWELGDRQLESYDCPTCGRDSSEGCAPEAGEAEATEPGSTWRPVDLGPILAGDHEGDRPAVLARNDGELLLYPARLNTIYGEPEGLKTWLALEACSQELRAGNVVLFIDFEDAAGAIVQRLLALGVPRNAICERFIYKQPEEPIEAGRAHLEAALARRPTLAVLDGVTEAMTTEGLSLKDNGEVADFYDRLPRWLARRGPVALLLDHVVKSQDSRGRYAIGAMAKLAGISGAAYSIQMRAPFGRGRTGRARLYLTKDRPGWIQTEGSKRLAADVEAVSDGGSVTITLAAPTAAEDFLPTLLMERISCALSAQAKPVSGNWVAQNVTGNKGAKEQALLKLVDLDYVRTETGPRNSRLYSSLRPFSEAEPARGSTTFGLATESDLPHPPAIGRGDEGGSHSAIPPHPGGGQGEVRGTGEDDA